MKQEKRSSYWRYYATDPQVEIHLTTTHKRAGATTPAVRPHVTMCVIQLPPTPAAYPCVPVPGPAAWPFHPRGLVRTQVGNGTNPCLSAMFRPASCVVLRTQGPSVRLVTTATSVAAEVHRRCTLPAPQPHAVPVPVLSSHVPLLTNKQKAHTPRGALTGPPPGHLQPHPQCPGLRFASGAGPNGAVAVRRLPPAAPPLHSRPRPPRRLHATRARPGCRRKRAALRSRRLPRARTAP